MVGGGLCWGGGGGLCWGGYGRGYAGVGGGGYAGVGWGGGWGKQKHLSRNLGNWAHANLLDCLSESSPLPISLFLFHSQSPELFWKKKHYAVVCRSAQVHLSHIMSIIVWVYGTLWMCDFSHLKGKKTPGTHFSHKRSLLIGIWTWGGFWQVSSQSVAWKVQ